MAKSILTKPKGKKVVLSDGQEYTLSPFNLNTLADMEEAFDCDLQDIQGKLAGKTATSFRKLLYVLLKENYPELTLQDVGRLVEMAAVGEVITSLMASINELNVA